MPGYNNLLVYKKAFELAMNIFEISKSFPKAERMQKQEYGLNSLWHVIILRRCVQEFNCEKRRSRKAIR